MPATPPSDEVEPRVRIHNNITGTTRSAKKQDLEGFEEFPWTSDDPTHPHFLGFSGWQMVDEEHPVGAGATAYRLVHKLVRSLPVPPLNMTWPNLRLQMTTGEVTWGEPRFTGALPWRKHGSFLVPEWGSVRVLSDNGIEYEAQPNNTIAAEAHQETTPSGNYLELIFHLPDGDWSNIEEARSAGRAGIAALTATIDLVFGERILGPVLAEEVGEVFPDWHWNRRIDGVTVAVESQMTMQVLDARAFGHLLGGMIERQDQTLPAEERTRLRVASQWYWRAVGERDEVMKYLSYWLCVEALELGENANIKPVKIAVAEALDLSLGEIAPVVTQLYRVRNRLAHGKEEDIDRTVAGRVQSLARLLLEYRLVGTLEETKQAAFHDELGLNAESPREDDDLSSGA